jgi:hypothetical protein
MTTENIYTQLTDDQLDNTFKHLKSAILISVADKVGIESLLNELQNICDEKTRREVRNAVKEALSD